MANEIMVPTDDSRKAISTIDMSSVAGRMKVLEVIGGNSVAGKDYLKANKPTVVKIADVIFEWRDQWTDHAGEVLPAGWKATCVLSNGDLVHFSSWRVVKYLQACLDMWGANWQGITLQVTCVVVPGNTSYRVEFVSEGCGND